MVALGGLFVFVLVYNLFLSPPSRPTRRPNNSNAPAAQTQTATTATQPGAARPAPQPKATGQPEEIVNLLMQDLTPLDLRHTKTINSVELDKERGPVFAYYIPPPPKPEPPPPPPPITLTGVTPASAVAGTPRKITLTVTASNVPADAQMLFDGGVRPSRRLNEHQIATDLEPSDYASPRPISITIRSASDPKMFSTQTSFTIQPAPEPQFRYIGRLGEQALLEMTGTREIKRLGRGDTILNQWRIDAITDQGVDVTLTQYDIKRRVPLTEKTR
ncbi:MAG TPA: hypothetical protein VKA60_21950 [Blastocatellia bacterium]|nr:hypothetical protein [Blastocatellia bacterium]